MDIWTAHFSVVINKAALFGRQRQADLFEFEASLVYGVSSKTDRQTDLQRDSVAITPKNKTKQPNIELL